MKKRELVIVLDNIRSAFNVGSIFRTADAVGAKKLMLCGMTALPDNPKVVKTALGAHESVDWEARSGTDQAISELATEGYFIIGVELTEQSVDYRDFEYPAKVAIVLGHERAGLSEEILEKCEKQVHVPMRGKKESLNVAVCAGIIAYEILRD